MQIFLIRCILSTAKAIDHEKGTHSHEHTRPSRTEPTSLGKRQPEIYGHQTLSDINATLDRHAAASPHEVILKIFQSNHEGELVSIIGDHIDWADGILINPAAYTHTSVAIRDALSTVARPVIEIHLSNIYAAKRFGIILIYRRLLSGVIGGFGTHSYTLALEAMIQICNKLRKIKNMAKNPFIPFSRPWIDDTEIEAVSQVLASKWISTARERASLSVPLPNISVSSTQLLSVPAPQRYI